MNQRCAQRLAVLLCCCNLIFPVPIVIFVRMYREGFNYSARHDQLGNGTIITAVQDVKAFDQCQLTIAVPPNITVHTTWSGPCNNTGTVASGNVEALCYTLGDPEDAVVARIDDQGPACDNGKHANKLIRQGIAGLLLLCMSFVLLSTFVYRLAIRADEAIPRATMQNAQPAYNNVAYAPIVEPEPLADVPCRPQDNNQVPGTSNNAGPGPRRQARFDIETPIDSCTLSRSSSMHSARSTPDQ